MVVQIVARILVLGVQAFVGIETTKEHTKPIIKLCE
jgi:hypothetical protein